MPPTDTLIGAFVPTTCSITAPEPQSATAAEAIVPAGTITVRDHKGATVVSVVGQLDRTLVASVLGTIDALGPDATALVVDLDQATLTDEGSCVGLEAALRSRLTAGAWCMVTSRRGSRACLDGWGVAARTSVFGSVADALQLRTFAATGYGPGWAG